ncbi:hypothetical protein [Succinivibrio dextrinosolvens]|uniref:hypothetical protein n=1 Tax=Succinivibrio dextrinosolvens TaxID=83771 RepID=UPI00247937D2|nr:hypothetical protein [Succinivibrio dextrinosolvens]
MTCIVSDFLSKNFFPGFKITNISFSEVSDKDITIQYGQRQSKRFTERLTSEASPIACIVVINATICKSTDNIQDYVLKHIKT